MIKFKPVLGMWLIFLIIFNSSEILASEKCGRIDKIYHMKAQEKEEVISSPFLKIYRNKIPITAKVGMEIITGDQIQAEKASVEFDIIWDSDKTNPSICRFAPSENVPLHMTLEKCSDEIYMNLVGNMVAIIKSDFLKKLFKVKTKSAIVGISGTIFSIQQFKYGDILKILVLNGQVILSNNDKEILIGKNEEGISILNKSLTKENKSIDYIHKEINQIILQHDLSPIFIQEFNKFDFRQNSSLGMHSYRTQPQKRFYNDKFKPIKIDLGKQENWIQELKNKFEKNPENMRNEFQGAFTNEALNKSQQKFQEYMQKELNIQQDSFLEYKKDVFETYNQRTQEYQNENIPDSRQIIDSFQENNLYEANQIFQDYQRESLYDSQQVYQEYQRDSLLNSKQVIQQNQQQQYDLQPYQQEIQQQQQQNFQQFQQEIQQQQNFQQFQQQ